MPATKKQLKHTHVKTRNKKKRQAMRWRRDRNPLRNRTHEEAA